MLKNIVIIATEFHKESMQIMVKEAKTAAADHGLKLIKEIWEAVVQKKEEEI